MHTKSTMSHSLWPISVFCCYHVTIKMVNICVFLIETHDKSMAFLLTPPMLKVQAASMYMY